MAVSTRTLILEHTFNLNKDEVYAAVANFERFASLHPVMTSVKVITTSLPDFIEYAVEEEMRVLGILVMKPKYNATVSEIEKFKQVRYTSQVKKGIFLTLNFHFSQQGNVSTIREEIEVSGNKLITAVFLKILKKAHLTTFERLRTI